MLIQYAYIKPRSQFGKQSFFEETDPIMQENILPDPEFTRDCIHLSHCYCDVRKSEDFTLNQVKKSLQV